jgi:hypothetical protein
LFGIAHQLRDKIFEAQEKSQKKIEEEFKVLLEVNFNSLIQFNPWIDDEEAKSELKNFLEDDFREDVLNSIKLKKIFESWTFYILSDKQSMYNKFRFLMINLLKMGRGDELVNQIKKTFKNNSKRFYSLMLDHLMASVLSKAPNIIINNKKEIFAYLDWEDILTSFALLYLIFSGLYISLERLADIFKSLCDSIMQESQQEENDEEEDKDDGVKSQKSQGMKKIKNIDVFSDDNKSVSIKTSLPFDKDSIVYNRKRQVYFSFLKEEIDSLWKSTAQYFTSRFEKSLKKIEGKVGSININELRSLKLFFEDLAKVLKNKYEVPIESITKSFKSVLNEYVNDFCKKKKEAMEILLRHETWKTVQVLPFFQNIIKVVNDLQASDEEFIHFDKEDETELQETIMVEDNQFYVTNSTLELIKSIYSYINIFRNFEEVAVVAAENLVDLLKTFNYISGQQILGSEAFKSGILDKGITAKHLAVTVQSLSLIMVEIPFLRGQLLWRVLDEDQDSIKQKFDVVFDDIDMHKTQIFTKLSSMLVDVIKKSMRKDPPSTYTNSESNKNFANHEPGPFIVQIVKSMNSLNKVICSTLSEESRKIIFTGVFPQFIDEIETFVDTHFIEDSNEVGFEMFKLDIKYLEQEISELAKGISTGQAFINKIREIQNAELQDFELEDEEEEDEDDEH